MEKQAQTRRKGDTNVQPKARQKDISSLTVPELHELIDKIKGDPPGTSFNMEKQAKRAFWYYLAIYIFLLVLFVGYQWLK